LEQPILPIEDTIDLHSFKPQDVPSLVAEYIYQAHQRGFLEVRIIHGRGIGTQRQIVHTILSRHQKVLGFRDAMDRGSTLVCLKQEQKSES
jgi:DNA-nicking Smr family endonuclease